MPQHYRVQTPLPVSKEESFAYHERPGALDRLVPPWETVEVESSDQSLAVGSRVVLKNKIFGLPIRWVAEHTRYEPPHLFADRQVSGPFAQWDHRHEFGDHADGATLTDDITYRLPAGPLGRMFGSGAARKAIERMFAFRHRITRDDLTLVNRYALSPQTIAISGAGGMVGSSFASLATLLGHQVRPIVRHAARHVDEIAVWHDDGEAAKFESVDTVVHLAGKSIADGRWNDKIKQEIRDSRVIKTRQLCERLAARTSKPKTLICASAIGIYGSRGDESLSETASLGDDFLAQVGVEWEEACQPAIDAGIRVVHARFGIVLAPDGGALQKTLTPAKLCGGKLGNGNQWWSWIALDDVVGAIYHSIANPDVVGPVNFVAPNPVQNADFAAILGKVLSRPAVLPAPAFALRLALGEMADALLLSSTRVVPGKLQQTGYEFRFSELEPMLRYALGRDRLESVPNGNGEADG